MIKAIIIDDEKHGIEMLKWELDSMADKVTIIKSFQKPTEGLEYLQNHKIDLLFLDIEMPGMNGFELLGKLAKIDFEVIFTTAYDQFALKAIKLSALDYLLKPINAEDLKVAIDRYLSQKHQQSNTAQYELLLDQINNPVKKQKRIAIMTAESIELLEIDSIIYMEAANNYTLFYLADRKLIVSKTLKHFESSLGDYEFIRLHHSFLVNFNFIAKFEKADGGQVIMKDGTAIPVSRRKKEELINLINSKNLQ